MRWHFRALGSLLDVYSELSQLNIRLGALLTGYEVAGDGESPARCCYLLRETETYFELLRDGKSRYRSESCDDVLDYLQIDLYRYLVAQAENRWLLHAAALAKGNDVIVLAGPSDAGKSTLCRALMAKGWEYLSEEIVSLGEGDIDALRRPLHLEDPKQVAGLPMSLHPIRLRDEPASWIAAPPELAPQHSSKGFRTAAILRIQYRPGQGTELVSLRPAAALEQLWDCRMNTGLDVVQLACAIVAKTPCYRLDSADVESAVTAIISIDLR